MYKINTLVGAGSLPLLSFLLEGWQPAADEQTTVLRQENFYPELK